MLRTEFDAWYANEYDTLFPNVRARRYVWPAELDLMAELAGLSLQERWADWERNPFTGESESHVWVK